MLNQSNNYAYALTKSIFAETEGKITIQTSNIYPILKSLKDDNLITEDSSSNPTHTMYKITEAGKEVLSQFSERIRNFYIMINHIFENQSESNEEEKIK